MEELHSSDLEGYDFGAGGANGGSISISSQLNTPVSTPTKDKGPPKPPRLEQDHHSRGGHGAHGGEEQQQQEGRQEMEEVDGGAGDATYAPSSTSKRGRDRPKPKQRTGRAQEGNEEEVEETKTKRLKKGTEGNGRSRSSPPVPPQRQQSSTTTATATHSEDDGSAPMEAPELAPKRFKGPGGEAGHRQATKIEQVLRQLKEDVVPLNRNSREGKTKWKMMVENMQLGQGDSAGLALDLSGAGGAGGDIAGSITPHSHLRFEDETHPHHHERVDKSQVGADIYSNRWKKMVSFQNQKLSKEPSGLEVNNNADKFQGEPENAGQQGQATPPPSLSHKVTFYFSGLLAGLFLWSMLFAASNAGGGGDSVLVKGSAFLTVHTLVTTGIMLIVVVGFINSVFTLQGSVADFERILYHFLPVLLILICHYVSKALELRSMECGGYLQLGAESRAKVHESYKCSPTITVGVDHGTGSVGFMFLHLLPWLAALGIYTYLHIAPPAATRGRQGQRQ